MLYHLLYPLKDYFSAFNVFRYSTFRSIYALLTAVIICFLIAPFIIKKLGALNVRQNVLRKGMPAEHYGKSGTPTMGGIIILISVIVSTLLWARLDNRLIWIVLSSTLWFSLIGYLDDYLKIVRQRPQGLIAKYKFLGQLIGALGIIMFIGMFPPEAGYATHVKIPLIKLPVDFSWFYYPFAILIIVGASNAVNLTDGLDGLATGTTLFCAMALTVVTYLVGHSKFSDYLGIIHVVNSSELVVFCAAIVGTCLGFLWFNVYPAQIFLGDIGALGLGGALGTISLLIKQELLLVLIGGIFVIEALSVIIQVASYKITGKRVFKMAPLHHHFELSGIAEPKIVVRFWIVTLIIALASLSLLKLR